MFLVPWNIRYNWSRWLVAWRRVVLWHCVLSYSNLSLTSVRHVTVHRTINWIFLVLKIRKQELRQWSGVRVPAGAGDFSFHHRVQTGSGAHPASYPMGTGASFRGGKAAGSGADHSSPSSAEVKEFAELYLHSTDTPSWCGSVKKKAQGHLHLYIYIYISAFYSGGTRF
jgi:hypothetical protein